MCTGQSPGAAQYDFSSVSEQLIDLYIPAKEQHPNIYMPLRPWHLDDERSYNGEALGK